MLRLISTFLGSVFMVTAAWADTALTLSQEFQRVETQASTGDTDAMECLSNMYWYGVGTQRNPAMAADFLAKAAAMGDKHAAESLRMVALQQAGATGNYAAPFKAIQAAAVKGDAAAETNLGNIYEFGLGDAIPQDTAKAFYWLKKGAQKGRSDAKIFLASFYAHGWGTKQDRAHALVLLSHLQDEPGACASDYFTRVVNIIAAHIVYPSEVIEGSKQGYVYLRFRYKDGQASDIKVTLPSGDTEIDAAALQAVRDSKLPLPPPVYQHGGAPIDMLLSFFPNAANPGFFSGFTGAVRRSIYLTMVVPKELLIHGTKGSGISKVHFDYLDGKRLDLKVASSSGDTELDDAVLQAVETAKLPATPAQYKGKRLGFWMIFDFTGVLGLTDEAGNAKDDYLTAYVSGEYDAFAAAQLAAIAKASIYPAATNVPGAAAKVSVTAEFDYQDGKVSDIIIDTPGVDDAFKQATIAAVQDAIYPPTPKVYAGKLIRLSVTLDFNKPASTPAVVTGSAPSPVTARPPAAGTGHGG